MTMQQREASLPMRMVMSSFAGMGAAIFCHPLDTVRVQMQVDAVAGKRQFNGTFDAARQIVRANGVRKGLYPGLSAAFVRQWTYGSCRMGVYSYLLANNKPADGSPVSFGHKVLFGMAAGGIGAFAGTPSELALVRMTADSKAPLHERRGYKNVADCFMRIVREEGVSALWKGASITVMRATVLSSMAMGVTSEAKQRFKEKGVFENPDGIPCMFVSTLIASFVANCASMPFDVIKSRLQNQSHTAPVYNGMLDCVRKSIKSEGVYVLWRGFTPAFVKLAPYTTLSLTFLDMLTKKITGNAAL